MGCKFVLAEVGDFAASYEGPPFHALLSDPPYHLTSITQRFGAALSAAPKKGVFRRRSGGFMGQQWDGGGVAFRPETWAGLGALLHPGAFGMAYSGARTYHRLACAIEDAGFIIDPLIGLFGWVYGSGFTSPTRIDRQVEDEAAAEAWQGHRYGADCLKPALEPICVFQRPFEGKPVQEILANGAGTIWIEGSRVATNGTGGGRWPSNFALLHHPDCDEAGCVPGCGALAIGRQSGPTKPSGSVNVDKPSPKRKTVYGAFHENRDFQAHGDEGTAARYFRQAGWAYEVYEALCAAEPVRYQAKPASLEKDLFLEDLPDQVKQRLNPGGLAREPRFAPTPAKNPHPTVKSIEMAIHLARLLLPPPEYRPRRILVPFAGTGSEAIGALLAGWEEVVAVEQDPTYLAVGERRTAGFQRFVEAGLSDFQAIMTIARRRVEGEAYSQESFFEMRNEE